MTSANRSQVRDAIEAGDADRLRDLVTASPALATDIIRWGPNGKNAVPPLHFVCDAVFRKLATEDRALDMARVLLEAGESPGREYAKSGDTFLITAASLGAERVGLELLERGADPRARGLFGATALHWCAFMGLPELGRACLDAGAPRDLVDKQHDCTPLEWALHAWLEGTNGNREGVPHVARVLVNAGSRAPEKAREQLASPEHRTMLEALG